MKNTKGFTLVELLAVIVIMGILMMVAIPAVSRTIENSRKDTFVNTAKSYATAAIDQWTADGFVCGDDQITSSSLEAGADEDNAKEYYIAIDSTEGSGAPELLQQGGKSSWGNKDVKGFVKIKVYNNNNKRVEKFIVKIADGTHAINADVEYSKLARGNIVSTTDYPAIPTGASTCVEY